MQKLQTRHNSGYLLLELALVLALTTSIGFALVTFVQAQRMSLNIQQQTQERALAMQALEGFILSRQRLPCPAEAPNGPEARQAGQCDSLQGWLPTASLGVVLESPLRFHVADLAKAGPPAQGSLTADRPLEQISPALLAEIITMTTTANQAVGLGPLPALHICGLSTPPVAASSYGCGNAPLLSSTAVAVILPSGTQPAKTSLTEDAQAFRLANEARTHQFFADPHHPTDNPHWLSFERLMWLWMQSGALHPFRTPNHLNPEPS